MATKTLAAPEEAPYDTASHSMDMEPDAVGSTSEMKVVLQPGSQASECRSPREEEGNVGADVPLTLPSSLSIRPSQGDRTLEDGIMIADVYAGYGGMTRSGSRRGPGTDATANTEAGAPAGGSLPSARTVEVGMPVLCLDISCPQDGGPEVKRWRSAEVSHPIMNGERKVSRLSHVDQPCGLLMIGVTRQEGTVVEFRPISNTQRPELSWEVGAIEPSHRSTSGTSLANRYLGDHAVVPQGLPSCIPRARASRVDPC